MESIGLADVDAFLVIGDLSYDNGVGPIWDDWANLVEPVACATPMMVLPGNHEVEREPDTGTAFRQYRARFAAPEAARGRVGYGYWGSGWDARHGRGLSTFERETCRARTGRGSGRAPGTSWDVRP